MTRFSRAGKAVAVAAICLAAWATARAAAGPVYRPNVVVQIGVSDLTRSIHFYEDVMGFKMIERRDDLQFAHIDTAVPGLQLGLSGGGGKGTGAAIINIGVADTAAARSLLESRGVVFNGPTEVIPGKVALAGFKDPDGNQLRLAGPAPKR